MDNKNDISILQILAVIIFANWISMKCREAINYSKDVGWYIMMNNLHYLLQLLPAKQTSRVRLRIFKRHT